MLHLFISILGGTLAYILGMNAEAATTGKGSREYNNLRNVCGTALIVAWLCFLILFITIGL